MRGAVTLVLLLASSSAAEPRRIETVMRSPQSGYRLTVARTKSTDEDNGRRLAIYAHGRRTMISIEGGLAPARESIERPLLARNRLHSAFVFNAAPMPARMIVVFGPAFASDPGALRIIRLSATSSPQQIFADETFALTDVRRGSDGRSLLVIGKRSLSQMSGNCTTTYDPYSVFELSNEARGRFRYSVALSKQYNFAHYAGWAGPDAREDVGVNICKKPARIVKM